MKLYLLLLLSCFTDSCVVAEEIKQNVLETQSQSTPKHIQSIEVIEMSLNQDDENNPEKFTASDERIHINFTLNTTQAGKINVIWKRNEAVYATIPMTIETSSPCWHGHADIHALAGSWNVQIASETGEILKEQGFALGKGSALPTNSTAEPHKKHKKSKKLKEVLKMLEPKKKSNPS